MPVALVVTVGGSAAPIINAIEQMRPDRVYFICSSGGDEQARSDRTIESPSVFGKKSACPHCGKTFEQTTTSRPIAEEARLNPGTYRIVGVEDPDNLAQVYRVCEQVEQAISADFPGQDPRIIANYTGGTKTMTLGLGAYALRSGGRWELQCNYTPRGRKDLIKIDYGDFPLPQEAVDFQVQEGMALARELEARHDYEGAIRAIQGILKRAVTVGHRDLVAQLGRHLGRCEILSARDRFEHGVALELARRDREVGSEFEPRQKLLDRAVRVFDADAPWGKQDVSGSELVSDLVANASRCADRQRFDDAVARLYRATELLAQIKLRRDYAIRTDDVAVNSPALPEALRNWLEPLRSSRNGRVQIGLFAAYHLLHDLGDPLGDYFAEHEEDMHGYMEARNQSILAHGLAAFGATGWQERGLSWLAWLDRGIEIASVRAAGVQ